MSLEAAKNSGTSSESLKKEKEAFWGHLAKLAPIDAIYTACEILEERGESINRDSVRAVSGVSFTNQIATGIALYKNSVKTLPPSEFVPTVLLEALAKSIDQVYQKAQTGFDENVAVLASGFEASLTEGTMENGKLQEDVNSLQEALAEAQNELVIHSDKVASLEEQASKLVEARSRSEAESRELALANKRLKALLLKRRKRVASYAVQCREQIDQAESQADHRVRLLTEQHDKVLDKNHLQLDAVRTELKQERALRHQDREKSEKENKALSARREQLAVELATQNEMGIALERDLAKKIEECESLTGELLGQRSLSENIDGIEQQLQILVSELADKNKKSFRE